MGLSGRAILDALCAGESDPLRLAKLVRPNVHATEEQFIAALTAEVRELLSLIDAHNRCIKHLQAEIERHLRPFEEQVERCEQITGVSRHVLHVLMAEVGTDLARFTDGEHISSWAGVCPGNSLHNSRDGVEKKLYHVATGGRSGNGCTEC
jgi:transposase